MDPWDSKKPNGTKFVRDISCRLLGRFNELESHMKVPWPQMHTGLVMFSQGPGDLKRAHGAQILSGILYMLANTGLIFTLNIYRGYMPTFNTIYLLTLAPDIIGL